MEFPRPDLVLGTIGIVRVKIIDVRREERPSGL